MSRLGLGIDPDVAALLVTEASPGTVGVVIACLTLATSRATTRGVVAVPPFVWQPCSRKGGVHA